jgi:hypothetical protein
MTEISSSPKQGVTVQSSKDIPAILDRERVNLGTSAEIDFVSRAVNVIVPATKETGQ